MTRQIIFKAGEVAKIDPRFIGTFEAEKLLLAKKSRLESQKKYEAKKKANGNKPLRRSRGEMEYTINKLERKLKIEKRLKKFFLILILLKPIFDSIIRQIIT